MAVNEEKYLVLKLDDIREFLTADGHRELQELCEYIEAMRERGGRTRHTKYIVCNQDEPYANKVWETILRGEDAKVPNA